MKFSFKIHKNKKNPKKLLILDRDGVIIKDTGYPHEKDKIIFEYNNINKIKSLYKKLKFNICGIATNQSGVTRDFFSEDKFWECHNFIIEKCSLEGLNIYFTAVNFFKSNSYYRKPNSGMIDQTSLFYKIKKENIMFIGDKKSDEEAAKNANVCFEYINKI
tara:strand:- start:64 stop:546 length:483 start_codon:yes stop_codon:yes gene_type:complete